jgi:hypothetical protein
MTADEISKGNSLLLLEFEPLADYEQFAYRNIENKYRVLRLLAKDTQSPCKYRLIGEFEGVEEWSGLQFSRDKKVCFFLINERPSYNDALYMVDGRKGTVEYIRHVPYTYRTSFDGKLLLFENISYDGTKGRDVILHEGKEPQWSITFDRKEAQFILYDIQTRSILNTFEMMVKRSEEGTGGAFYLTRDETGKFKVTYSIEGGRIAAFALIDPVLNEIRMVWDNTDNLLVDLPNNRDKEWRDDIQNQWKDETLRVK